MLACSSVHLGVRSPASWTCVGADPLADSASHQHTKQSLSVSATPRVSTLTCCLLRRWHSRAFCSSSFVLTLLPLFFFLFFCFFFFCPLPFHLLMGRLVASVILAGPCVAAHEARFIGWGGTRTDQMRGFGLAWPPWLTDRRWRPPACACRLTCD